MEVKIGEKAPEAVFEDNTGKTWRLPDDFNGKKTVLVFLRHLGCPLCMRRIDELKSDFEKFKSHEAQVIVFVQSTWERARKYAEKKALPFMLVGDREKTVYSIYGVERGGVTALLAPSVLKKSLSATLKGYMHGPFEGDELQKPAEFVLDEKGVVIWAHYGKDISDSSDNEQLLKVLKG